MKLKVPRNVLILSIVSFFNDVAAEMIYPLVPIFLTSVLQVPVAIVGLIEGIAEGTASLTKFIFGYLSDRFSQRKPFVVWGYSFAAISKVLIAMATGWPFVLFAKFIDRMGKGIRTAPRDALLLQNATPRNKGFIFGFHRSMDSAGAVVGPLVALLLLSILKENMRLVFLLAAIPSLIGVALLILFVREKKEEKKKEKKAFFIRLDWRTIDRRFTLFLLISIIFALGNSSDAFILLRVKGLGFTTTLVTLSYVLYNVSQTLFATPAGQLADKIGARKVYAGGLLIFAVVYLFFGLMHNPLWIWFLFPLYGIYIAFTDGVSKAYIAEFITEKNAGSYFGLYQTGLSLAAFLASFVGGILWSTFSPPVTFYYGSAMALLAFLILTYARTFKKF